MKNNEINIRDPFVYVEGGLYYMYGTRAKDFGCNVGGMDVYVSEDLENWSEPVCCFDSEKYGMNRQVNWAPEVHKYEGEYYMFATFTRENGLRGTFALKANNPKGPFVPHSEGPLTPVEWEALDGSLYVENGTPYLVFCHEHTQIMNGAMCYIELSKDLKHYVGEPVTMFTAGEMKWVPEIDPNTHYVTDGPFMVRNKEDKLYMIWSTFIDGQYAECLVEFVEGSLKGKFVHLDPLIDNDGGHGMVFMKEEQMMLTFHSPNKSGFEHPKFMEISL